MTHKVGDPKAIQHSLETFLVSNLWKHKLVILGSHEKQRLKSGKTEGKCGIHVVCQDLCGFSFSWWWTESWKVANRGKAAPLLEMKLTQNISSKLPSPPTEFGEVGLWV